MTDTEAPETEWEDILYHERLHRWRDRVATDAVPANGPNYSSSVPNDESEPTCNRNEESESKEKETDDENEDVQIQEAEEIVVRYNEKALSRFAPTYRLEEFKKNALIIFNYVGTGDDMRQGTARDVEALTDTFEKYGFEVRENIHNDLTRKEILDKLKEFTSRDFTDYGCIGVVVLTHGSHFGYLRAKDGKYSEMDIINQMKVQNKPTLVTKPKLLIIQACRGSKVKPGVPVFQSMVIRTDTDTDPEPYHLPEEADILVLHSCYVGNPSFRHALNGSWFIQSLCSKIDQLALTHDLESIVTEVKREVAIDRYYNEHHTLPLQMTQMPVLTSTLVRKLYLRKYGDAPPASADSVPMSPILELPLTTLSAHRLDEATSPLLPTFGPCSCFLQHFTYIRECLKHYAEDNPDDEYAGLQLELANSLEDKVEFNTAKEKMIKVIHQHLRKNAETFEYYKYLYLYDK